MASTPPARLRAGLVACALSVVLASVSCAAPVSESGPDESMDLEGWGIGSKADEGGCEATGDLCWGTEDSRRARTIARIENDVLLGRGHAPTALGTILELAGELEHKLTAEERAALDEEREQVANMSDDASADESVVALSHINANVLNRVRGSYFAAHMVPIGRTADHELNDDSRDGHETAPAEEEVEENPHYSDGMRESLRLLRENGAMGKAYVWMLEATGVLERDYQVQNAQNFGAYDSTHDRVVPVGISRNEQVDRIIDHHQWAAFQVGVVAGAEGLIPIAGVPISIAHETYKLFELHTEMAFEIAAVYGWDIREGRNLFTVAMMVMTYGSLTEVADILASNAVLPIILRRMAIRFGFEIPIQQLERQLARRSVQQLMRIFGREAQEQLAGAALRQGAKGVGRQLLGYATLGLAVLASGAIDAVATEFVGEHVQVVSRRWMYDLMQDGTTYLARPRARDCMYRSLQAMMWADRRVSEREKNLYMAFLAKPYRTNEASWMFLDSAERTRHARDLREREESPDLEDQAMSCLDDQFTGTFPKHRMSILAHLYGMANVDTWEESHEGAFYDRVRAGLDGDGWFDGSEIDPEFLDYIERSIYILVYPGSVEWADEHQELVEAILPEDVFPFLGEPNGEVLRDFRCGYDRVCR